MFLNKKSSYDWVDLENLVYGSLILNIYTIHINILGILRNPKITNLV